jgi:hypothetical protein
MDTVYALGSRWRARTFLPVGSRLVDVGNGSSKRVVLEAEERAASNRALETDNVQLQTLNFSLRV